MAINNDEGLTQAKSTLVAKGLPIAAELEPPGTRKFVAYDLLESVSGFGDDTFAEVWSSIFRFCATARPSNRAYRPPDSP